VSTAKQEERVDKIRPFDISKQEVWRAYEQVKRNKGAAGIDEETIKQFEDNLKDNLYKLWSRLSSGSYFPPAVKEVSIPKKDGGQRKLGIPTVADRIAQTVAKNRLEPKVDPLFHDSSYGYRPKRSALQAVEACKINCWQKGWVVDLDIKGFFDNIDHELLMRVVRKHTDCKWVLLYIERWLTSPMQKVGEPAQPRTKGTPQGGVISPLLANIFLHHAFDTWFEAKFSKPRFAFERYADDIVIHCMTLNEAQMVFEKVKQRMQLCKLELHPEKTKIVLCEDGRRVGWGTGYPTCFDFLGFTFKKRTVRGKQGLYDGFMPGMSKQARGKIQDTIKSWHIGRRGDLSIEEMSRDLNPVLRGWVNYYGQHYKRAFAPIRYQFHIQLTRWALRKYRGKINCRAHATKWIYQLARKHPNYFALWEEFYD